MTTQKDRIEAAIRHIQTSVDIDPWAEELAVDALGKQIPKKPTNRSGYPYDNRSASYGYCPECGLKQIVNTPKYFAQHDWYCRKCGQAIDWGTDEE